MQVSEIATENPPGKRVWLSISTPLADEKKVKVNSLAVTTHPTDFGAGVGSGVNKKPTCKASAGSRLIRVLWSRLLRLLLQVLVFVY